MSNCPMCEGVGKIPQRGAETSGAREVCPTCNGVGTVPEGTQETHVYNAPASQPEAGIAGPQGNVDPILPTEDAPKVEGADSSTDSSSERESGAPEATEDVRVCPNDQTEWKGKDGSHCPKCDEFVGMKE